MTRALVSFDDFFRPDQSGWGTASDNEAWVQATGTATLSIVSNKGQVGTPTGSTNVVLGTAILLDGDFFVRHSVTAGGDNSGLLLRYTDANNFARIYMNGSTTLQLDVRVSGTTHVVATAPFTRSANKNYLMHVSTMGDIYNVRIWLDGTPEPTDWKISAKSAFSLPAGQFGLFAFATASHVILYDKFSVMTGLGDSGGYGDIVFSGLSNPQNPAMGRMAAPRYAPQTLVPRRPATLVTRGGGIMRVPPKEEWRKPV